MNPKVSVLMPVYNAAPFLAEAIDSILAQTYADFEFLIINDGSTDRSEEIITAYRDSRIRYAKNEKNLGLVATLNKGIDLSRGEYIARMDADDISLPDRFARQVAFMNQHSEVGACGTSYQYFGDRNHTTVLPEDFRQSFTMLSFNSSLGHPTSMIRCAVLEEHGIRYESEFLNAEDYAFWIRIGRVASLTSIPEPLLRYRWHSTNVSQNALSQSRSRSKARILWHELLLKKALSVLQKNYLEEKHNTWESFLAAKEMISEIMQTQSDFPLDQDYYGKIAVTEWELRVIDCHGFRGLLTCLSAVNFQKQGYPTTIGLIAYFLRKKGITLPSKHKS